MRDYYERRVVPLQPQLVVIYPTPSFYLFDAPPAEWGTFPVGTGADEDGLLPAEGFRLVAKARGAVRRFIPRALQSAVRARRLRSVVEAQDPGWVWRDVPVDRMEHLATDLERLIVAIRGSGARPVLVTHSNRFQKPDGEMTTDDRHHLVAIRSLHPRASPGVLVDVDEAANRIIRELGSSLDVAVIETEGHVPPRADYFADYSHFTDAGADLMARILAEGVLSLQPVSPVGFTEPAGQGAPGSRSEGPR